MQVKKFEAPTIQEALETIKRELGPEAIILQTKQYKRGFGLMSKASVEVTAAVSDRSLQKKQYVDKRMPEPNREQISRMAADRQADLIDRYAEKHIDRAAATRDHVQLSNKLRGKGQSQPSQQQQQQQAEANRRITATRYIDIDDPESPRPSPAPASRSARVAGYGAGGAGGMEFESFDDPAPHGYSAQPQMPSQQSRGGSAGTGQARPGVPGGMSVEDEVKHLKRMIEELRNAQERAEPVPGSGAESGFTPAIRDTFEQLCFNGIDKRYAFTLVRKVGFELGPDRANNPEAVMDALASEIMTTSEVASPFAGIKPDWQNSGPNVIALVGPTGVGKTTTVAKMASEAILKRNLKVGLINLDSYKVAAFDQLATYAKILNVPFRSATSGDELKAAIQDFRTLDLVLVDTTGRSQRDPNSLKEMQTLVETIPNLRTQMVLSAVTRDAELYDVANRFSIFKPQGIVMSKLDEASIFGSIYNLIQKTRIPMLYFTTGQRVPEDIEEATKERIAALILDI